MSHPTPVSRADSPRFRQIRSIVEGVYTLTEWREGENVLDPDTVSARLVIQDGALLWIANSFQPGKKVGYAGIGAYQLSEQQFSYGYQQLVTSVTDAQGDRIDRTMPDWAHDMALPAMRDFTLSMDGESVTLSNPGGTFEMTADGCVYTDLNTGHVRVWRKLKQQR